MRVLPRSSGRKTTVNEPGPNPEELTRLETIIRDLQPELSQQDVEQEATRIWHAVHEAARRAEVLLSMLAKQAIDVDPSLN